MDANRTSPTAFPAAVESYFFAQQKPIGMALLRIIAPLVMLIDVVLRHPWAREIYSSDGAPAPLGVNFYYPGLVPVFNGPLAVGLHAILIAALLCVSVGWMTRVALGLSVVLYTYFGMLDCLSTVTKYTVISTHMLLLLFVSASDKLWSLDAWLERRRNPHIANDPTWELAPVWPARLMQLFVAIVYLGAAITKMHTPSFFNGDQMMYWTMTNVNNIHPLGDWLSQHPVVLSVFSYITIIWEVAFIFMIFQPRIKWTALAVGAFFHLMTTFTLGLFVFPVVMYSSYLGFVMIEDWEKVREWQVSKRIASWLAHIPNWLERFLPTSLVVDAQWKRHAGFALALTLVALSAMEVEHLRDHYQERGPNGPLALQELSDDEVARLFERDTPIRATDKLLAFDLGTIQIGEHVVNRRTEFEQGERIIAQATVSPPHEDMWIDCWLQEARTSPDDGSLVPGRSVRKVGHPFGREGARVNFIFPMDESLPPGEYFLRLRTARDDLVVKQFTLKARSTPLPAARRPIEPVNENEETDEISAN